VSTARSDASCALRLVRRRTARGGDGLTAPAPPFPQEARVVPLSSLSAERRFGPGRIQILETHGGSRPFRPAVVCSVGGLALRGFQRSHERGRDPGHSDHAARRARPAARRDLDPAIQERQKSEDGVFQSRAPSYPVALRRSRPAWTSAGSSPGSSRSPARRGGGSPTSAPRGLTRFDPGHLLPGRCVSGETRPPRLGHQAVVATEP
jgi:hypothetical protein